MAGDNCKSATRLAAVARNAASRAKSSGWSLSQTDFRIRNLYLGLAVKENATSRAQRRRNLETVLTGALYFLPTLRRGHGAVDESSIVHVLLA